MSEKIEPVYAYPHLEHADYIDHEGRATQYVAVKHGNGMLLRDWFAGQALAGILSGAERIRSSSDDYDNTPDVFSDIAADDAYTYADAMMEARKQS